MNLLNSALCLALNTGDYQETSHAINELNKIDPKEGLTRINALEIAAGVLAKEYKKRDYLCCALMRQNDFLAQANKDLEEKHRLDEKLIEHRTNEVRWLESKNKRLSDALAEIEAGSVGWRNEVARQALGVSAHEAGQEK